MGNNKSDLIFKIIIVIILIISLFFGMIKYKWFTAPDECFTYSECFFDMLNSGIRGGSGMGFGIKNLDQKGYLIEFILEWIIFLVVMLVLLNIINGVIVSVLYWKASNIF